MHIKKVRGKQLECETKSKSASRISSCHAN